MYYKKTILTNTIGATLLTCATMAQSANWLMLQGTEPVGESERAKVWGFIQAQYQKDTSDPSTAPAGGGLIPPKVIGPNLDSQEAFNVNRARIGIRGTGQVSRHLDVVTSYFHSQYVCKSHQSVLRRTIAAAIVIRLPAGDGNYIDNVAGFSFNHIVQ